MLFRKCMEGFRQCKFCSGSNRCFMDDTMCMYIVTFFGWGPLWQAFSEGVHILRLLRVDAARRASGSLPEAQGS